jgi:hypothetical protein
MSAAPLPSPLPVAGWQRGALFAGLAGLVVCLIAALLPDFRQQMFRSWLVAFNLCLGVALGSLVVVMLQYLTGGAWGFVLRRPLEAATRTLPLLAVLFLPLMVALLAPPYLYPWADEAMVEKDADLQAKVPYLNAPWFLIRAAIYFAIWNVLQYLLNRWSMEHDQSNDPQFTQKCANLSAPGLILYALTITFASIDWVMSLEPKWYSTIYGAMFGMGQVLSGFAFGIAVFLLLGAQPPLQQATANRGNLRDLGSLLLAFVMVWAYLSFDQFLLMWSGNLPEEFTWYAARLQEPWYWVALSLVLLMFAAPFVLLLSADLKRSRRGLAAVAILIVCMRLVELFWLIVPAFHHHGDENELSLLFAVVLYVAAVAGIGGMWLAVYLWQLQRMPLLPVHPPEGGANGETAHH